MNILNCIPLFITLITILGNYFIPKYNKSSIGGESDKNKLDVTPSGWTFSIWSIIYFGLLYLSVSIIIGNLKWDNNSIILFILSCIGNLLWIYLWTSKNKKLAQLSLLLIVLSLGLLWYNNINKSKNLIYQNIIALYFGWSLGALLLNIFIVNYNNIIGSKIIVYLLCLIQLFWFLFLSYKNKKQSWTIPFVGIWTGLGILTNDSIKLKYNKYILFIVSLVNLFFYYTDITRKII